MTKFSLLINLEAQPGKEADLENFLISEFPQQNSNHTMAHVFAMRTGKSTYGVFDTFNDDNNNSTLRTEIAAAIFAKASEFLIRQPFCQQQATRH